MKDHREHPAIVAINPVIERLKNIKISQKDARNHIDLLLQVATLLSVVDGKIEAHARVHQDILTAMAKVAVLSTPRPRQVRDRVRGHVRGHVTP